MERLFKGLYRVKEKDEDGEVTIRLWHDCKKYKDRDSARIEIFDNGSQYECSLCGFAIDYEA